MAAANIYQVLTRYQVQLCVVFINNCFNPHNFLYEVNTLKIFILTVTKQAQRGEVTWV